MMIKITFPDNSVKEFESGITPLQIAESISPRLAQEVLAATVDGQEWDLSRSINADAAIKLLKKYRRPMLSTDSVNVEKNIKLNLSANSKTVR